MYRCVQQTAPAYLCELIHPKKNIYGICSYSLDHLHLPDSVSKLYGDRAWNLPSDFQLEYD